MADPQENEVLLPPNTCFEIVSSYESSDGLVIVQCRQTEADDPLYDLSQKKALLHLMEAKLERERHTNVRPTSVGPTLVEPASATPTPTLAKTAPATSSLSPALVASLSGVGLTPDAMGRYAEGEACSFWFMRASVFMRESKLDRLLKMQDLRNDPGRADWLVQRVVTFADVIAGACYDCLVVSHRWEEPDQPDKLNEQFMAIRAYIQENPSIAWVWYGAAAFARSTRVSQPSFTCSRSAYAHALITFPRRGRLLVHATRREERE